MENNLNATCAVCGSKYHMCQTCADEKKFKPWKSVTDTVDCYLIHVILCDYNNKKITIEEAKKRLSKCAMPKEFLPHIGAVINEIMSYKSKVKEEKKEESTETNKA